VCSGRGGTKGSRRGSLYRGWRIGGKWKLKGKRGREDEDEDNKE